MSLDVDVEQTVAVIGQCREGKTTLLRLADGRVLFESMDFAQPFASLACTAARARLVWLPHRANSLGRTWTTFHALSRASAAMRRTSKLSLPWAGDLCHYASV